MRVSIKLHPRLYSYQHFRFLTEYEQMKIIKTEINYLKVELKKAKEQIHHLKNISSAALNLLEDLQKTTANVQRAKNDWVATFDGISDPIFIHDNEFKIVKANKAYQTIVGTPFEDIIGKPYYKVFPKLDGPFKMCLKALKLQEKSEEEVSLPSIDKIFKVKFYPIKDVHGEFMYSAHILVDITGHKRAEEALRVAEGHAKHIIDCSLDMIITVDNERKITEFNKAAQETFGYTREEVLGRHVDILYAHPDEGLKVHNETIQHGRHIQEILNKRKNGEIFPSFLSASVLRIAQGEVIGVMGISRDITKRKQMEKKLKDEMEMLRFMNELDRNILSTLETREILETTALMVSKIIPSDRVTVVLVDKEKHGFVYKAGFGINLPKDTFVSFDDTSAAEIIRTGNPQSTSDLTLEREPLLLERTLIEAGYRSHVRIPLVAKEEVIGLLNVGSKRVAAFIPEHLSALEKMAAQIAVALENARLVADLKEMFLSTAKAFSAAIDAKSPWTAGHSERVTQYAVAIGKEMDLDEDNLKDLEIAGLLHDVGKLGTYQSILDKAYYLTNGEKKMMRLHPEKGAEILSPIKQMRGIIPAIRHHHEFYNGGGYPDGLKEEEIPLMARILCVADSVDAMSADRPYRKGMPMDVIVKELRRCSGIQFESKVVDAFSRHLAKNYQVTE